jgi:hypothetical protein
MAVQPSQLKLRCKDFWRRADRWAAAASPVFSVGRLRPLAFLSSSRWVGRRLFAAAGLTATSALALRRRPIDLFPCQQVCRQLSNRLLVKPAVVDAFQAIYSLMAVD